MSEFSVGRGSATLRGSDEGAGQPVVFLHAGVADRRSWYDVIGLLGDEMRCVAYDQRGYGDTTWSPESYSATDDLLAVLEDRGLERVRLVGASRGGHLALDFALATPE